MKSKFSLPEKGFSLVEVVLAIGILSFVVAIIVALFSQLYRSGDQVNATRSAIGAASSLKDYLQSEETFDTVYGWAGGSGEDLAYASFLADEAGDPAMDPDGQVQGKWYSSWAGEKADIQGPQQGRWLKARLRRHPTLNPGGGTLPALSAYPHSYIVFEADIYSIEDPDLTPMGRPVLSTSIVVHRK